MSSQYEHFDTLRLNAISISEVARRLGESPRRVGVNQVCTCPWHEDHQPSLTLYERTNENRCHCFACRQGGSVIDFTMQHEGWTFQKACRWLSSTFGIPVHSSGQPPRTPLPKPAMKAAVQPVEPEYTYIPPEMMENLVSADNSLCQCLMQMFRSEAVENLVAEYQLGCYAMNGQDDYTVFPNIDAQGRICNLKVQHYDTDPESARFSHSDGCCLWLGKVWSKEGRLPAEAGFRSACLFGEHLLPHYPAQTVALVESPKNALFGALQMPQYLWVATGNKGALKREVLLPLQGRNVIVLPDCDAVADWTKTIATMADLANFVVSDFCRRMAPADQPKFDIADYITQQRERLAFRSVPRTAVQERPVNVCSGAPRECSFRSVS